MRPLRISAFILMLSLLSCARDPGRLEESMKAICEGSGLEHVIPAELDLPPAALPVAALEPKQILFLTRAGWSAMESEPRDFDGFRDPELRRFMVKAASPEGGGLAIAADRTLRARNEITYGLRPRLLATSRLTSSLPRSP